MLVKHRLRVLLLIFIHTSSFHIIRPFVGHFLCNEEGG